MMTPDDPDLDDSEFEDERDPLSRDHDGHLVRGVSTRPSPWDSFRHLPPETESDNEEGESLYKAVIKFVKLLVYLLAFVLVLAGSIMAKGSLLLMTSQLDPDRSIRYCNPNYGKDRHFEARTPTVERTSWTWVIFFAFIVPELGTLIRSLRIGFFKVWHKPTFMEFFIPFLFETCHAIGLGLFVYAVLPTVDVVKGVMLTNCLCVIPALLGLFGKPVDPEKENWMIFKYIFDSLMTIFQISGLLMWPLLSLDTFPRPWLLPISGILISMGWWENYVDKSSPIGFIKYLGEMRGRTRDTRYFTYTFISIWKMLVFFGVMIFSVWLLSADGNVGHLFDEFVKSFQEHAIPVSEIRPPIIPNSSPNTPGTTLLPAHFTVASHYGAVQWALYIQIVTAYVCYIVGKFACKICIQGFSFAFPVSLSVPVTLTILISFCGMRSENTCLWKSTVPGYLFWTCPEGDFIDDFISNEYAWVWLMWLLSQAWVTRHIWTPSMERLLATEKLFTIPMYCSLLIDQSLALNRKRDNSRDIGRALVPDAENDDGSVSDSAPPVDTIKGEETFDEDAFPHIIACATMWHENKEEMMEMLKSIFRMDIDQCARRIFKNTFGVAGQGYYEFETHVFFDDAFELRDETEDSPVVVNTFVRDLVETVEEAACHVHEAIITLRPPTKIPTPYGGRLEWILPGKTRLIAHLKNKDKIRHKKRWSQIMYMYYLLGYKLLELPISVARKEVIAENTYLLALDGDIDFQPNAVELLVDLMKKNKNLGAACGRIHPTGSGPMVWYQKFEYAIGHWLQKATEHMIGCVLCSPGCFSLFRAKALMEDNVMKKYTTMSDEPRHYVQYDQGEDRWLCTLLLQRGYRVEYSAASDAKTHAPESFNEFYNQRRRWVPSTMANIFDLLMDAKHTIRNNPDISRPYIFYQILLMGGSILGPGTIFLMLVGAFVAAFSGIDNVTSLIWNSIPILVYLIVCYFFKSDVQLIVAQLLSAVYALVMVAVLVALSLQIAEDGLLAPSSIFLIAVALSFIISAILHPLEFDCLVHGLVYYITIPSMYLLLIIYSLFNMNNVSWGTREAPKKKTAADLKEEAQEVQDQKKKAEKSGLLGFLPGGGKDKKDSEGSIEFSLAGLFKIMCCVRPKSNEKQKQLEGIAIALTQIGERLHTIENTLEVRPGRRTSTTSSPTKTKANPQQPETIVENEAEGVQHDDEGSSIHSNKSVVKKERRDSLINPVWIDDKDLLRGNVDFLSGAEITFWNALIAKYLYPILEDKEKKKKIEAGLIELRNQSVFAFFMINAVFVLAIFLLQLNKDILFIEWPLGVKINMTTVPGSAEVLIQKEYLQLEPIGLVFVAFFAIILIVQFTAMLFHRFGTISHILSATPLITQESAFEVRGIHEIKKMQKLTPENKKDEKRKSTIDPGRRKTIHNLERQRVEPEKLTMDGQFRRRYREFEQTMDKDPNLRGTRFQVTFQELRQRRSTVLFNRRNSVMERRKSRAVGFNEGLPPTPIHNDAASRAYFGAHNGVVNQGFVPENRPRRLPTPNTEYRGSSSSNGMRNPIMSNSGPGNFQLQEPDMDY